MPFSIKPASSTRSEGTSSSYVKDTFEQPYRLERGGRRACYHDHNFDRTIDREIQLKLWIANHSSPAHFLMH
jgi:hypothetical protein